MAQQLPGESINGYVTDSIEVTDSEEACPYVRLTESTSYIGWQMDCIAVLLYWFVTSLANGS